MKKLLSQMNYLHIMKLSNPNYVLTCNIAFANSNVPMGLSNPSKTTSYFTETVSKGKFIVLTILVEALLVG